MKRNNKLKFQALIIVAAIGFIAVIILFFLSDNRINESNIEYINSFGWIVEENPTDIVHMTFPDSETAIFGSYSEILKKGGFDISTLPNKRVIRYSYKVLNHKNSDSGLIRINIIISDGEIVAADITSLDKGGFVMPINNTSGIN